MTNTTADGFVARDSIYAEGKWLSAHSTNVIKLINPATEEHFGSAPDGDLRDVDTAVAAARRTFDEGSWPGLTPAQRAPYLDGIADHLQANIAKYGPAVTRENGTPITQNIGGNILAVIGLLKYYSALARDLQLEEDRGNSFVRREPVGVAGLIIPWNGPGILAWQKIIPAMVMGCTTVVKPAAETALSSAQFAEAAEAAGLPPGVINIVTGGRDTGRLLVEHRDVDKIAFTGSSAAGRQVAAICGAAMKPVTLELGGKSAAVILRDGELSTYLSQAPMLSMVNAGQACFLSTRVLVDRERHDELVEGLVAIARSLPVGDPMDPDVFLGPVVNEVQHERVLGYIEKGKSEGATLAAGGGRPRDLNTGYFIEQTVFGDVDSSMVIAQEEIFGPVVTVIPYDSEDDAIRIANDTDYGLGGVVITEDLDHGTDVARRITSGSVGVNCFTLDPMTPFGGRKQSGLGREMGPEGVSAYSHLKTIYRVGGRQI